MPPGGHTGPKSHGIKRFVPAFAAAWTALCYNHRHQKAHQSNVVSLRKLKRTQRYLRQHLFGEDSGYDGIEALNLIHELVDGFTEVGKDQREAAGFEGFCLRFTS